MRWAADGSMHELGDAIEGAIWCRVKGWTVQMSSFGCESRYVLVACGLECAPQLSCIRIRQTL